MQYKGEQSNLSHMTPFLPLFFSQLGPYGNTGKLKYKSEETIKPHEAIMLLSVTHDAERSELPFQQNFEQYRDFVESVKARYIEHLCDNMEAYDELKKYRSYDDFTREMMIKMMTRASGALLRTAKAQESTQTEKQYLVAERKLYYKSNTEGSDNKTMFLSEVDEAVF